MYSCLTPSDPLALMNRYTTELVLVATHGSASHRDLLLRRYDSYLGGVAAWITALPEAEQAQVLSDALRCREGHWPRTMVGQRIALPRWFRPRVKDPWQSWRTLHDYRPQGIALDPVCLMLVDPEAVRDTSSLKGETIYFCCPGCLAAYEGDPNPSNLAEVA
jgi:YHS domain-containing protein